MLALLLVAILAAAGGFVTARLRAPVAAATVTSTLAPTVTVSSPPVTLPWAAMGQSAISVPSLGVAESSSNEVPVPIASLTKLMTAYVILRDHPLAAGQSGPNITMTPADVADYEADTTQDQANAAITVGEVLTELQLLEGMLVHSANDFADALATWDAGTLPAFVAKMNQAAAQLGMTHTTFADASGYSAASQSTASDILIVAAKDMEDPTLASIVRMPSVTLPVAGTVATYTPLLGFLGTVGVKSGFTSQAGGCDVLAVARRARSEGPDPGRGDGANGSEPTQRPAGGRRCGAHIGRRGRQLARVAARGPFGVRGRPGQRSRPLGRRGGATNNRSADLARTLVPPRLCAHPRRRFR